MNALLSAKTAYGAAATPVRTDRGTEYALFTQITRNLQTASMQGASGYPKLVQALHENRLLWITLAADVADKDNTLPEAVRARIFYLAEFTKVHTRKVIARKATAQALIDINTAMMRGLAQGAVAK